VHVVLVNEHLVGGRGITLHSNDQARDLVTRAMQHISDAGIRVSGSTRIASYRQVPQRIVAEALHREADAIVLGSHRKGWLARLFSPRVRQRVTRLTSLPVITAPAPLNVTSLRGADRFGKQFEEALAKLPR
jgi:nucleotide-binding universal stress UspA family protein